MAADVNLILLAAEGLEENEHTLHQVIFGAQGIKLPALIRESDPQERRASAADVKSFLRRESKRFESGARKKKREAVPVGEPPPR